MSTVINLTVADLDGTMERARAAGATVRDEIQIASNGGRAGSVFDPFGHIWCLIEEARLMA